MRRRIVVAGGHQQQQAKRGAIITELTVCTKWFSSISAVLLFGMTIVMLLIWALENTEGRLPGKSRF